MSYAHYKSLSNLIIDLLIILFIGYGDSGRGGSYQGNSGGGGGGAGVCYAFQKGECTRGSGCRFSHDNGGGKNEC